MNSVHLIGRLATDAKVKEVNGGSTVSSFILAVDRNHEEADFAILRLCAGLHLFGVGASCQSERSGEFATDLLPNPPKSRARLRIVDMFPLR
jgi:Single-strand binding protein family